MMKKRILSALAAAALAVGLLPAALAAAPDRQEAAEVLAALDIMVGDQNGNLNLSSTVTRAEFTRMVISASPFRDSAGDAASVSPYPDVPKSHWAAPYIQAAVGAGYVSGYLDGTFRPGSSITLAEGVTMVLKLLGYENSDFTGAYPAGQMAAYRNLNLDEGISASANSPLTRGDVLCLFYNLMTTKNKSGVYYLNVLEAGKNLVSADGVIDRVALVNDAMEGPVVADAVNWQSKIPFDLANATVYRDGKASSLAALQSLDVVYWSKPMNTLWAYTKQVTGTLEAVAPNTSSPASVTVAGQVYALESNEAAFAFSNLGQFRTGDNVTLLMGRTGNVAAVRGTGESGVITATYGIVTAVADSPYTDNQGNSYNRHTITVMTTSGAVNSYPTTSNYRAGDLVRITTENGELQIKRPTTTKLSGVVSRDGKRLGNKSFAANVEILDTYEDTAVRVYPERLAGLEITERMVRFCSTNAQGEIERLILREATGDTHTYGILTSVNEVNVGMMVSSSYVVNVAGQEVPIVNPNGVYNLKQGPCVIKGSLSAPDRITNLDSVRLDAILGYTALTDRNQTLDISERVAVFEVRDDTYYYSSLARVSGGGYTLTGYYDKAQDQGGRIRVILARSSS